MRPRAVAACATLGLAIACKAPPSAERHGGPGELAAHGAELFAHSALVQKDFAAAYRMLPPDERARMTLDDLEHDLRKEHASWFPRRIRAVSYELLPEHTGILVLLVGEGPAENCYYKVGMLGTPEKGYVPSGLLRSDEPFPPHTSRARHLLTE